MTLTQVSNSKKPLYAVILALRLAQDKLRRESILFRHPRHGPSPARGRRLL